MVRLVGIAGVTVAGILFFGLSNAKPPSLHPELGGPLPGLTEEQMQRFLAGKEVFALGPLFNASNCAACHEDPVAGGAGRAEIHATRLIPPGTCDPLEGQGGPVIPQQATPGNRSTPPIFGFGLLDAIPEATILAHEHRSGGRAHRLADGRVGRFGRKAQVASLLDLNAGAPLLLANDFVRFLAPPQPKEPESRHEAGAIRRGHGLFHKVGCATCHMPSMRTGPNPIAALDRKVVHLYSDLLLHDMGPDLADICLGEARPNEFRTAPLMGLRFLSRFLHDGRATTVEAAIQLHGGQATHARAAFASLSPDGREALLTFLGSL